MVPFFPFSSIFFSVLFNEFTKYKNLFNKCSSIKKSKKNKNWLKFPDFSSVYVQSPLTPIFPGFPVDVETMISYQSIFFITR